MSTSNKSLFSNPLRLSGLFLFCAMMILSCAKNDPVDETQDDQIDVRFITTPMNVVSRMLAMADLKEDDIVYDLGCGDGRIIVEAAKQYGVSGIGFDLDMERVLEARKNAKDAGVDHLVDIQHANIFELDLSKADVIMMYLLPELNVQLLPQLEKMKPGSRIVSHNFDIEGITPDKNVLIQHVRNPDDPYEIYGELDELDYSAIYLWTLPFNRAHEKDTNVKQD